MVKVKCPKCHEEFELGTDAYQALVNEISNEEFNKRITLREAELKKVFDAQLAAEKTKAQNSQDKVISELNATIKVLNEKLANADNNTKLAVNNALEEANKQIAAQKSEILKKNIELFQAQKTFEKTEAELRKDYDDKLKKANEDIERWRDYRMGDSTKDLGESLEQYCHDAFEAIRADAYPYAYFEKDNESVKGEDEAKGSKGDFIFRDYSSDGIEFVSILFDMKTEKDNTETKKTNEHHLKKLDSDRNKKGCEYAVLVSTLEADSSLYNKGIVDVSHKYPKTFVVRPQFFLAIIGLIRNMAKNTLEFKRQVQLYEKENADVTNFEKAVKAVADKINADYDKASAIYNNVDEMCDAIIKKVETFRRQFKVAAGHIGAAVNQLSNLEISKLTKNNPTMKEKFDSLKDQNNGGSD